jgi:hypothetical protein
VSLAIKERIQRLLEDSLQFNANDILVHIDSDSKKVLVAGNEPDQIYALPSVKKIIDHARQTERENGINPLCKTEGLLHWEFRQQQISTPIFIVSSRAKVNKLEQTAMFENGEHVLINPFLIKRLKLDWDILLPENWEDKGEIFDFLQEKHLGTIEKETYFIGNFHHHRFEIVRELEELLQITVNPSLAQLLGDECQIPPERLKLTPQQLFASDPDQELVFDAVQDNNTVVQGPPGTGKSQVLANLIAKLIFGKKSALVVSEKRVALEVLQNKLSGYQLEDLCFVATSETSSREVLQALNETWKKLEAKTIDPKVNLLLSEQYLDQLQLTLDLLNDPSQFGGVGYKRFTELVSGIDLTGIPYQSGLPDTSDWLTHAATIETVFQSEMNGLLGQTKATVLRSAQFRHLDEQLKKWIKELDAICLNFEVLTFADLERAMKKAALCQQFSNSSFQRYELMLTPDSKEQKKFLRLYKKYVQLKSALAPFETEKNNWIVQPSMLETEVLLEQVHSKSFIGKWKAEKAWKKIARIPLVNAEQALHEWRQYLQNLQSISQIEIDFCDLGLMEPKEEVAILALQIQQFKEDLYLEWRSIPTAERAHLAQWNASLNRIYNDLKLHFHLNDDQHVGRFLSAYLTDFSTLIQLQKKLEQVPEAIIRHLAEFATFSEMQAAVLKRNEVDFVTRFPQLAKFQQEDLHTKTQVIFREQQHEADLFAQHIRKQQLDQFHAFHTLLRTPANKLSEGEKVFKNELKKGKSILVKEFAKTRNHPTLRELYASEARVWIQLLKPVWMSNPVQVAKCFPMETLFDVAIFDEASQIPLQNALGSIQRSKRILVAGDQQQMGPSSFFKAQAEEQTDILHQASYYWKNSALKHHYRSEHPELIRFSNRHFYNNELLTFPSPDQEKEPIEWHFVEHGIYDNRENQAEAKRVAEYLETSLHSHHSLGVVAFSETQLECIYRQLSDATKVKLEERIENNSVFFKALENVQGEECDQLIISVGYGKDPEGEFHMRFGPLNSKNGARRLNVLLTRARKKMVIFSSIRSSDFKLSSNEAVELFRQFFQQIENKEIVMQPVFSENIKAEITAKHVRLKDLYSSFPRADELVTFLRVLSERGWIIGN